MYKLTNTMSIIRLTDNATIPNDMTNNDYKEYLIWASANTPNPAESLLEIKSRLYIEIKAYRDIRKSLGVKVGTHWYHSDDSSRIQQLGLVLLGANIPPTLMWKTMSGDFVQMTQTLAQQIFQSIAMSDTKIFATAESHKSSVSAYTDPANYEYDYKTGWPVAYGE